MQLGYLQRPVFPGSEAAHSCTFQGGQQARVEHVNWPLHASRCSCLGIFQPWPLIMACICRHAKTVSVNYSGQLEIVPALISTITQSRIGSTCPLKGRKALMLLCCLGYKCASFRSRDHCTLQCVTFARHAGVYHCNKLGFSRPEARAWARATAARWSAKMDVVLSTH